MTEVANVKFPGFTARMIGNKIISFDYALSTAATCTVPAHVDVVVNDNIDDKLKGCLVVNNHYFNYPIKLGAGIGGELLRKAVEHTNIILASYHAHSLEFDSDLPLHFGNLINPSFQPATKDVDTAAHIVLAIRMFCALGDGKLLYSYIGKEAPYKYEALANKEVHEVVGRRLLSLIIGDYDTTGPVAWETMPLETPTLQLTRSLYDWVMKMKIRAPALFDGIIKLPWVE